MIKTVITCDRCGLVMATVDSRGPSAEDRLVVLAEKCGHRIDTDDICRGCQEAMEMDGCGDVKDPIGDDEITKEIVVPSEYRRRRQSSDGADKS